MAAVSYKCPNCDGELVFHPSSQNFRCEYCGSGFSPEEIEQFMPAVGEESVPASVSEEQELAGDTEGSKEGAAYNCPSCGAQIVTEKTTAATFCYYCHNPVVLSGSVSGKFLPQKIIPFTIDKKQAVETFLEYVHNKKFVPKAFFNKRQIEKLSGVYFPYWMADLDMRGTLQAEGKNIHVRRRGDTEIHETKVYQVERTGRIHLEDITKNALQSADFRLAERVLPYDVSKMQDFHISYLSGFLAQRRDIDRTQLQAEVAAEARNYGEQMLRDTITGYSQLSVKNCQLKIEYENWDYILLPVWTLTYKGADGKRYYYSMNGQNGKVYGELPVDIKKVWMLGGIVFLVVFLLGLTGGFLL